MKKLTIGVSSFIAGAALMTALTSYAAPTVQRVSAFINPDFKMTLNEKAVKLDNPALTYEGKTYVYLKDVGSLVDSDVIWNSKTKTVEVTTDKPTESSASTNKPVSIGPKYGYREVFTIDGQEYVHFAELLSTLNGTGFTFKYDKATETVDFVDNQGKIVIDNVKNVSYLGWILINYNYFLDDILPLAENATQ